MFKKCLFSGFLVILAYAPLIAYSQESVRLGIPVTQEDLLEFDLIAPPDGSGFPPGGGTAQDGKQIYDVNCAVCHGASGEGTSGNTVIVGGDMQSEGSPLRTVGSYWPYASTLFDFIRRAMPATAPKSLTNEQVYQVTAYVLFMNDIIEEDTQINGDTISEIDMPNANGFIDRSHIQ